jgi:hypothetical protein
MRERVAVNEVTAALLLLAAAATGCRDQRPSAVTEDASATVLPAPTTAPTAVEGMSPLGGEWLVHLPIEGFGAAAVSVPLGATAPRSVIVGVHGRNDRPEWACGEWRGVTSAETFILCPHGVPVDAGPDRGLAFAGAERTRREIDAGLAALRARFGAYVADGPMIYAGFSLGAIHGVPIVADDPTRFPVVVLGEGGQDAWTPARVASFAQGGRRVLFVCSTGVCETATARPLGALLRAGVEVKLVSAGHIGHLIDDRVVGTVRAAWPWVLGTPASP